MLKLQKFFNVLKLADMLTGFCWSCIISQFIQQSVHFHITILTKFYQYTFRSFVVSHIFIFEIIILVQYKFDGYISYVNLFLSFCICLSFFRKGLLKCLFWRWRTVMFTQLVSWWLAYFAQKQDLKKFVTASKSFFFFHFF